MSSETKYARTHEWARVEGETVSVGITKHAADELGDVALVLLPEAGRMVTAGNKFGEIESIKAVSDLYSPVTGEVVAANDSLTDAPETINDDPHGGGWMVKIKMADPSELAALMDGAAYDAYLETL